MSGITVNASNLKAKNFESGTLDRNRTTEKIKTIQLNQISAKRGPASRLVIKVKHKPQIPKSNSRAKQEMDGSRSRYSTTK